MAVNSWATPESAFSVGIGSMSSLAVSSRVASSGTSGSVMTSGIIQNSGGYKWACIELYLTHASNIFASNPTAGSHFSIYAIPNISGTSTDGSTSVIPTTDQFIGAIQVPGALTMTSRRMSVTNVPLPNSNFLILVQNNCSQALNSSLTNAVVTLQRYNEQTA
jgi:hypothetical protein